MSLFNEYILHSIEHDCHFCANVPNMGLTMGFFVFLPIPVHIVFDYLCFSCCFFIIYFSNFLQRFLFFCEEKCKFNLVIDEKDLLAAVHVLKKH